MRIRARAVGTSNWYTIAHVVTDSSGTASFTYMPWRPTILEVTTDFGGNQPPFGFTRVIHARPLIRPVSFAAVDPVPTVLYPIAPPAIGRGANVKVSYIPPAVQASMIGNTWSPGCVPLSKLRYITANYWGFDGFRYRGNMVVAASVAGKMRRVLAGLYSMRYQIRSMWVEDRYGRNPFGPGANDYLSMAADNTSAFNCRYIVGKERQHIWSPHASGKAVDINTWENPYRSSMGAFPNSWWLPRSRHNKAVLREFSPATRLLGHYKFRWGGFYGDFQHFQQ